MGILLVRNHTLRPPEFQQRCQRWSTILTSRDLVSWCVSSSSVQQTVWCVSSSSANLPVNSPEVRPFRGATTWRRPWQSIRPRDDTHHSAHIIRTGPDHQDVYHEWRTCVRACVSLPSPARGPESGLIHGHRRTLSSMCSVHLYSRSRKIVTRSTHTQGSSSPLEMLTWNDEIMSVVGLHKDEIHVLTVVRKTPIVECLSPW
jgi:hypothetical protein